MYNTASGSLQQPSDTMGLPAPSSLSLLLLAIIGTTTTWAAQHNQMSTSMMDACFPVMPMEKLNHQPHRHLNIFTDFEFSCGGEIAAWNLYAGKTGHFYASVWRKHPDGRLEMIGKNYIDASTKGLQTYFIPKHLRFRVNAGDVMGIHYDTNNGESVVMCEDDSKSNVDTTLTLSTTIKDNSLFDTELPLGHEITMSTAKTTTGKRAPALFPVFNRNRLRLDGGKNEMEGRAMFFSNGQWGTICDEKFWRFGWPAVFCKELGYDHCDLSKFASEMYTGVGKANIGYQKPSCPSVANIFMDECNKDAGTCGHEHDVFVRCAYATKLEGGNTEAEGRAMSYANKNWGTICDKNPTTTGWASTLCNEIGFSHAIKAKKASDSYVGIGSGKINLESPTCEADKPYYLKYCAKNGKSCSHDEDIYVKCQHGVRLVGGHSDAEGRAEVYRNGQWGTVCLNNLRRDKYASVFCRDLGYHRAEVIKHARNAYTGIGAGHIADMNPDCTPQNAANILNCGHPTKTQCGHNKDIFIQCKNDDMCKRLKPCQHDGVCIDMENDYKCECVTGFTGPNCEQDIDDCESHPCGTHSTCIDKVNGFECRCGPRRTGDRCQHVSMTTNPVTISSYKRPTKSIYAEPSQTSFEYKTASLSKSSTPFRLVYGLIKKEGTVSIESINHKQTSYLRVYKGDLFLERHNKHHRRDSDSYDADASFYPEESVTHPGYYIFRSYADRNQVLVHRADELKLKPEQEDKVENSLFYVHDLEAQNSIEMFDKSNYRGRSIILTEDDDDLRNHGFDDKMNSLKVHGNAAWELFNHRDYNGKNVIVRPGQYDEDWVNTHIKRNKVSSVRKVQVKDGLVLWNSAGFEGHNVVLDVSERNLTRRTPVTIFQSAEVVGPSSWEIFTQEKFHGTKVVLSPGRFPKEWLDEHFNGQQILSARKVEVNTPLCTASNGEQKITGRSGKEHYVFVVQGEDGSVWFRFGLGNQENRWTYKSSLDTLRKRIISAPDVEVMKDFSFVDWEVQTDVNLQMSVDDSWHPSKIDVMYLGSKVTDTLEFKDTYTDRTDITFAADKSQLACTGRVHDGKVMDNVCGEKGLPGYGTSSNSLIITSLDMRPRAQGSHAKNRDFTRNAFNWEGSHYYVYGKLADCASSTGCYKREEGVSFVYNKVQAKSENRPETFYFGELDQDVDACEAACKDADGCEAFTLYKGQGQALSGGCYGVGKSNIDEGVKQDGVYSGLAMPCGSFIPEYMQEDMWTRNTTGCPCSFDTSHTDCACCHEGACQCDYRYKYQCTLCGFNDRCGSPFLTTHNGEYIFEYSNQQLSDIGRHYKVPGLCVTGCHMDVRGTDSSASEVAAYMTDINDNRVLSCVGSDLSKSNQAVIHTQGATTSTTGSSISRINLYSFGGAGEMIQLRLKVEKNGCHSGKKDVRYVGCYAMDPTVKAVNETAGYIPTFTSTHMTRATCVKHCYNLGHKYAVLKLGTTCECVDDTPIFGPSFTCDRFCSGDSSQICGGTTALSVLLTTLQNHTMVVGTVPGNCPAIGGHHITSIPLRATGDECKKLTNADTSGTDMVDCNMDWCGVDKFVHGGLFPSRPDSCGAHKLGQAFVRTRGADCIDMGGRPDYGQTEWGLCKLDFCTAISPSTHIFTPVSAQSCPAYRRIAEFEVTTIADNCRSLGGAIRNPDIKPDEPTFCQFEMCMQDRDPHQTTIYTFPHNKEVVPAGSNNHFNLPNLCVTECQFTFTASTENETSAEVTLYKEDGSEAGLVCGGQASHHGTVHSLSFATKATGVHAARLKLTAATTGFILQDLVLRTNPDGCKDNENILVLYDDLNFGGRPKVIKQDIGDLDSVDFNNKVTSFKIFGDNEWELFENKQYKGRSAVLRAGEYYDTSLLPFGNNDLSSVKMVGAITTNMDSTRREMSNARGIVCFERVLKSSAVFGLPPNTPKLDDRPNVFYFGNFGNDIDRCERACRDEPQCAAFTLFSLSADDTLAAWRGLCYGRSFHDGVEVYQEDVMSGYVASCTEEDTLTVYADKEYTGLNITIIQDIVNITFTPGPLSAMVTGKDTWRVMTESDGHIHTYNLAPGDYSDLSATFTGTVFQVSKMHPNTQLYQAQHNQVDLAPVAFNQIQKTITEVRTLVENGTSTSTQCNTTNQADVFFVIDSSSSIFAENYAKVLDFVAKVTESFTVGADAVRVGAIVYSWYTYYDIKLGEHIDRNALESAIKGITYYTGGTYTHSALKAVRDEGFTDAVIRSGVSKQAIVITDGESRWPDKTKDEAHLCRDAGITMTAVGIREANYDELHEIAGDASRVYNVSDFDQLGDIISDIEKTACTAVNQGQTVYEVSQHVTITVQGDDSNYFVHQDWEFNRKPVPLGMESGVIYNSQIFASSALLNYSASLSRLNHHSGWMTTIGNHTNKNEWIEIDLGKILPIHGISTQGHAAETAWVTKYKVAISLDGIHFVTFKDLNTTTDLVFLGNSDQGTIKYHCLHRLFGQAIQARVIRFIAIEWHVKIAMRIELYGYRDADDSQLIEILRKDVWTRNVTGCPCYFDSSRKDCACCEDGGCQCPNTDRHQCVQCGYPHMCGIPNLRNPVNNIDGWTSSLSGCRCAFDPLRTDCACCQSYGCQCGAGNKNQCVNCGHPEHCGLKEHIFGPNPYCMPKTCPRKINTIWEGTAPHGVNPGDSNPVVQQVD